LSLRSDRFGGGDREQVLVVFYFLDTKLNNFPGRPWCDRNERIEQPSVAMVTAMVAACATHRCARSELVGAG
jgi:hypothetical protein